MKVLHWIMSWIGNILIICLIYQSIAVRNSFHKTWQKLFKITIDTSTTFQIVPDLEIIYKYTKGPNSPTLRSANCCSLSDQASGFALEKQWRKNFPAKSSQDITLYNHMLRRNEKMHFYTEMGVNLHTMSPMRNFSVETPNQCEIYGCYLKWILHGEYTYTAKQTLHCQFCDVPYWLKNVWAVIFVHITSKKTQHWVETCVFALV